MFRYLSNTISNTLLFLLLLIFTGEKTLTTMLNEDVYITRAVK